MYCPARGDEMTALQLALKSSIFELKLYTVMVESRVRSPDGLPLSKAWKASNEVSVMLLGVCSILGW